MKLLKIFLVACIVIVTGIYGAEGSQSNILWHNSTIGAIKFMPVNSMIPENTLPVVDSSNTNLVPRGMGDFTGDGKPDILFHNQNSGNLRIWEMDGTTKVNNIQVLGSSNTNLKIAGVGDFDQDGDNDIATFNTNSGALRIWVMEGTVRIDNVLVLTGANTNLVPRGASDMDSDGIPNLVLRNNNSGAVRVWTMNSDFARKGNEYVTGSSNTNLELRGVVDINGDGNNDILNYNTNTGKLRAWLMDGYLAITDNAEIVQEADLDWSVRGGYSIASNTPPVANAGADQSVQVDQTITITGSGTDSDGTIVSYEWTKGSTLLAITASFTYTPTAVGTDTLTLTVMDDDGATASDSMVVTVTEVPNTPPVANAGADQSVIEGDTVTLDGAGSTDPDGMITAFEWKEGSTVLSTSVSFDKSDFSVGSHTITLTVSDNDGAIASDSMTVTVRANTPPVADVGSDQNIHSGSMVTLDGSGSSDADGDDITYSWIFVDKPEGSNASLSDATLVKPTFITDVDGDYIIELIVDDGRLESAAEMVTITAISNSGTLDPTFGGDGIVMHDNAAGGYGEDRGHSIVLDSDGNIYVAGDSYNANGNRDMTVWKFRSDGELDTSFSEDGIVMHANTSYDNSGNSIAVDSAGNVYVAGYNTHDEGETRNINMMIWKYKSNGTLDTTFSGNGIVMHDNAAGGYGEDRGHSIVLDSDGNIYVAGDSFGIGDIQSDLDMVIWKYRSDGTLDTTFDGDGIVLYNGTAGGDNWNYPDNGFSIVLDSTGNIYVTGRIDEGDDFNMAIWKYRSDGTLDTAFDGDGVVKYNGQLHDSGRSIALDSAGNIYVTGVSSAASDSYMAVWKYRNDGTPDTAFDGDGIVMSSNVYDTGNAIALDSAGNIYVTGYSSAASGDMAVWKYK